MNAYSARGSSLEAGRRLNGLQPERQLEIDWTRCDGHGVCRALLPDRFELDEWGFPILRNATVSGDPDELGAARRVVSACPALALRLSHP